MQIAIELNKLESAVSIATAAKKMEISDRDDGGDQPDGISKGGESKKPRPEQKQRS